MSARKQSLLIGILLLLAGGIIYILFREETHIAGIFNNISAISAVRQSLGSFSDNDFLRFYFPDYLWGLSLCCCLLAICIPEGIGIYACGGTAILTGIVWELLQYLYIVSGTGDIVDVGMYIFAGLTGILVYKRRN